jgi:hypothetical protein
MGVAVGSVFAFLIWIVCDIIGLIPITSERVRESSPQDHPAFWIVVQFFGCITYAMDYPLSWIRPGSILDGPQQLILLSLFWGIIFYLLFYAFRRFRHKAVA